ncbi:MAG TPA: hypothetical protein VIL51_06805 [Thermoleophilia bacterium]
MDVGYIKIIVAHSFTFIYPEKFAPLADDILEAIVDEAHKHGTWVTAHIDSGPDAIKMVGYGADEINHLIAMGLVEIPDESAYDELFQLMVDKETWFVPTIAIVRTYNHLIVERNAPRHHRRILHPALQEGLRGRCADGLRLRFGRSGCLLGAVATRGALGVRVQPWHASA